MRSSSKSTQWSGFRTTFPFTRTRPAPIQLRASVREPEPALEKTRSRVFSGRPGLRLLISGITDQPTRTSTNVTVDWGRKNGDNSDQGRPPTAHLARGQGSPPRGRARRSGPDSRRIAADSRWRVGGSWPHAPGGKPRRGAQGPGDQRSRARSHRSEERRV